MVLEKYQTKYSEEELPLVYEIRGMNKKGESIPLELSVSTYKQKGRVIGIEVIHRDITERKNAELELQMSERKYRELADQSPVIVYEIDCKGKFTFVNEKGFELTGYSHEDIEKGLNILQVVVDEDQGKAKARIQRTLSGEKMDYSEYTLLKKDGSTFPAIACVSAIVREGKTIGLRGTVIDITERKKAEEALRESEEGYRELTESISDMFFAMDKDFRYTYWNKASEKLAGISAKDAIGKSLTEVFPDVKGTRVEQFYKEALRTQQPQSYLNEYQLRGKDYVFEINAYPTKTGLSVFVKDITERKKVEEALRNSEDNYRSLFEKAGDGLVHVDLKGKIININAKAAEIAGANRDQLLGKSFLELGLIGWKDIPMLLGRIKARAKGNPSGTTLDLSIRRKDGEERLIEATPTMMWREGKPVGQVATVRDVTDKRNIERSLRESQARFEGLFIGNPEAAAYLDPDFRIRDINPRFEELFGYSLAEVQGKHINDVVVPDGRRKEGEALDKDAREGYVYRNTVRRKKDGSLVHVSVSAAPMTSEKGIVGIVAMYKDVSDSKNAEKKMDSMIEKLRVVGSLTRHDVRNKLTAVVGNTYLLKKRFAGDPDAVECLRSVETAVREAERIFDFAGAYEKLGVEQLAYVDVKKAVDEAVGLFPDLKGVKMTNDCGGLTLLADSLLRQLFYNLIDNSLKYGEKLTQIRNRYEKSEDKLKLIYEDDGVGISRDAKSKLFTEGFTTGKGSGYGLYLIGRMMEVYGWTIDETGKHGKGAQFTINIPKAKPDGRPNYKLG
jgi:PAS domain S-box-containing protein